MISMKNILAIALLALVFTGCKKDDGTDNTNNTCNTPPFDVYTSSGSANIQVTGGSHGFYEIEYGTNGFSQGSGTKQTVSSNYTISNLNNGTYDIYLRGNCGGTSWSEWSSPRSFIVTGGSSSSCAPPYNLDADFYLYNEYRLTWSQPYPTPGYYQVEYGETGFTKGTGTVTNASDYYINLPFTQGKTYDFYVRANCGGSDFSSWAGPHSFYADH